MNRSPIVLISVDRRSVGSDNGHPAPLAHRKRQQTPGIPLAAPHTFQVA